MKAISFLKLGMFILTIWISSNSIAQDVKIAKIGNKESILFSKENGDFKFNVSGLNPEQVTKSASYYIMYFTTTYNEKSGELTIKMVQSDATARRVILRLFTALGIQNIESEGKIYLNSDFYDNFLQ